MTGRRSPKREMVTGLSVTVVAFSHFGNRKYIEFDSFGVNRTSFGFNQATVAHMSIGQQEMWYNRSDKVK